MVSVMKNETNIPNVPKKPKEPVTFVKVVFIGLTAMGVLANIIGGNWFMVIVILLLGGLIKDFFDNCGPETHGGFRYGGMC